MRTQVGIIGGGPAGLLLSQLLHRAGIDNVVLERESREHVLARVRAGVLEWGTVEVLRAAGVADRMERDGQLHDGTAIVWGEDRSLYVDVRRWTGRSVMNCGQTRILEVLFAARDAMC